MHTRPYTEGKFTTYVYLRYSRQSFDLVVNEESSEISPLSQRLMGGEKSLGTNFPACTWPLDVRHIDTNLICSQLLRPTLRQHILEWDYRVKR